MSRDAPESFEIALAGGIHDAFRQRWRRRIAVPAAGAALRLEIIAQRLLVEACLRPAWLPGVGCPEARTVGGHHLVDQDDASVLVAAEFKLGVGDDDALVPAQFLA